jgi:hypothetical protein
VELIFKVAQRKRPAMTILRSRNHAERANTACRSGALLALVTVASGAGLIVACASQGELADLSEDNRMPGGSGTATAATTPSSDAGRADAQDEKDRQPQAARAPLQQIIIVNETGLAVRLCPTKDGAAIADPVTSKQIIKPPFPGRRVMPQSNRLGIESGGASYLGLEASGETAGDYVKADFLAGDGVAVLDARKIPRGALCTQALRTAGEALLGTALFKNSSGGAANLDSGGVLVLTSRSAPTGQGSLFGVTWSPVIGFEGDDNALRVRYLGAPKTTESLRLSGGKRSGAGAEVTFAEGAFPGEKEVELANEVFIDSNLAARNFEIREQNGNVPFSQGIVKTVSLYDPSISPSIFFGQRVSYVALMVNAPEKHLLVLPLRNPGEPLPTPQADAGLGDAATNDAAADSGPDAKADAGADR